MSEILTSDNVKELELIKKLKKSKGVDKEISTFLSKNLLDLNKIDSNGYNCLHYAIKTENPDIVNLLLTDQENGAAPANPNIDTNDCKKEINLHPLLFSSQEVNDPSSLSKIIKILVKHGADVTKTDDFKCNILHRVAEKGSVDLVSYILEKSPEAINLVSKNGTVLHMAVSSDHTDLVEYLLENTSIDLSLTDSNKNSALLSSIAEKNFNCFKLIIDHIRDSKVLSIEKKKELINQTNDEGNNILHEMAFAKSGTLIEYLLKFDESIRVDAQAKNKKDHTYTDIQSNIVKLIKEKEEEEKKRREDIRKEKLRLIEEKQRMEEEHKKEAENRIFKEEKDRVFRENLVKNRKYIIFAFVVGLILLLYFALTLASKKKKQTVVL